MSGREVYMEISGSNTGASTYAMKKAMEMPNFLMSLVQQTADSTQQALATKSPAATQAIDIATVTGKGTIIDLVA